MAKFDFDVCIIGGGPGGVIAAYAIAKAGYQCVIIDKKPRDQIGHKNCGDAVDKLHTDILLSELGLEPPSIERGEARDLIKYVTLAARDLKTKFTVETPGYLVDRLVYGQRLLQQAEDAGAQIIHSSPVREIIIDDDFIRGVRYYNQGELHEIRAKITIDASGYIGILRKQVPKSLQNGIEYEINDDVTIATYREIIELKDTQDHDFREEIVLLYHDKIQPPGYAWIFSEGERKLNIGITWVKSLEYPDGKSMKKIYHECLDPFFDPSTYDVIYKGGGNIPMRPNFDSLVFNGAMLVGDAAAMADPTTFEGHGPALESGRLAAKASIHALTNNDYSISSLWQYNVDVMNYPGTLHTQSFIAARLLSKIGVEGLHYILDKEILSEAELVEIFQEKNMQLSLKDQIFKFFKSFPRWGMMLTVKKYVDRIDKAEKIYAKYPTSPEQIISWINRRNKELKLKL